jgi:hypothetical protein
MENSSTSLGNKSKIGLAKSNVSDDLQLDRLKSPQVGFSL